MADTFKVSDFSFSFKGQLTDDDTLAPLNLSMGLKQAMKFLTHGTGAGEANLVYLARLTFTPSEVKNIDMRAALLDRKNVAMDFAKIMGLAFALQPSPAAAAIHIGGHATLSCASWITATPDLDTAQPKFILRNGPNGGFLAFGCGDSTGYPVVATTEDMLRLANTDAGLGATMDWAVIGRTA